MRWEGVHSRSAPRARGGEAGGGRARCRSRGWAWCGRCGGRGGDAHVGVTGAFAQVHLPRRGVGALCVWLRWSLHEAGLEAVLSSLELRCNAT